MKENVDDIVLSDVIISDDETHHLYRGAPLYTTRFTRVMSFHHPGIAAVEDENGAYHIKLDGNPLYSKRFEKAFGFYEGKAAVKDNSGWFHIDASGDPIYKERYEWVGNFQEGRCVVETNGKYFHIRSDGLRAYPQSYRYAGDYKYGIAVVYKENGLATHIDKNGKEIHGKEYIELGVFHKGYAVARDKDGFFHISKNGIPLYKMRYEWVEPFYNNRAFARKHDGTLVILDEETLAETPIRDTNNTYCKELARERIKKKLVGYWDTQILYCIAKTEILDRIKEGANTKEMLSQTTNIPKESIQMLLDIMKVWGLITYKENNVEISTSGDMLTEGADGSLKYAAIMWGEEHYNVMSKLLDALRSQKPQFEDVFGKPFFEYIKAHPKTHVIYNNAMREYALDYSKLIKQLPLSGIKTLLDVGGGTGILISEIMRHHKNIEKGILFDLPEVISQAQKLVEEDVKKIEFVKGDFFKDKLPKSDAIIMSRVLHDWDNEHAKKILLQINKALPIEGRLFILEMIVPDEVDSDFGITLNFNLLVTVGGHERNKEEFISLLENTGFKLIEVIPSDEIISILVCKKVKEVV